MHHLIVGSNVYQFIFLSHYLNKPRLHFLHRFWRKCLWMDLKKCYVLYRDWVVVEKPLHFLKEYTNERECVKLDAHSNLQRFSHGPAIKQPTLNAYRQTLKPQQVLTTEKRREVRDIKLPIKPQQKNDMDFWKMQAALLWRQWFSAARMQLTV